MRTIHRLQQVLLSFRRCIDRLKTVLSIFRVMTEVMYSSLFPMCGVITGSYPAFALRFFQERFQTHAQISSFRQPQRQDLDPLFQRNETSPSPCPTSGDLVLWLAPTIPSKHSTLASFGNVMPYTRVNCLFFSSPFQ